MFFVNMYKNGVSFLDVLNNILRLLKERNIRQKELTEFLSLSHNVFTEWKAGRNTSYMKHLPEIAEFFEVSIDYLVGNEQSSTPTSNFTYALYDEITHDLSEEQIEQLKKFADFLRNN